MKLLIWRKCLHKSMTYSYCLISHSNMNRCQCYEIERQVANKENRAVKQ